MIRVADIYKESIVRQNIAVKESKLTETENPYTVKIVYVHRHRP